MNSSLLRSPLTHKQISCSPSPGSSDAGAIARAGCAGPLCQYVMIHQHQTGEGGTGSAEPWAHLRSAAEGLCWKHNTVLNKIKTSRWCSACKAGVTPRKLWFPREKQLRALQEGKRKKAPHFGSVSPMCRSWPRGAGEPPPGSPGSSRQPLRGDGRPSSLGRRRCSRQHRDALKLLGDDFMSSRWLVSTTKY